MQTVWPEFDWERAYRAFFVEYGRACTMESLAETRSLEMVARCVVETGTSSFYRTLSEVTPEPVLKQITANISSDEVRHYKHFYRYFLDYKESERPGRVAILRQLWKRSTDVKAEDAYFAFKHVFLERNPDEAFTQEAYDEFRASFRRLGRTTFPYEMAVKMILKPLDLSAPARPRRPARRRNHRALPVLDLESDATCVFSALGGETGFEECASFSKLCR